MIAPAISACLATTRSQSIVALPKLSIKQKLIFLFPVLSWILEGWVKQRSAVPTVQPAHTVSHLNLPG
jgi:hypothetical protein